MSTEIQQTQNTLWSICDDLSTFFESREMVLAQMGQSLPDPAEDKAWTATLQDQLAEIDENLKRLGAELTTKTDNLAGVLRRMSTEQDALKDEQERIYARRKTFERAEKWLRDYTVSVMQQQGLKQLKTQNNTFFLRQSDAAVVEDASKLPEAYKNVTVKMPAWLWRFLCETARASGSEFAKQIDALRVAEDISLSAIKSAIKSGVQVDGADIEFHTSLTLR